MRLKALLCGFLFFAIFPTPSLAASTPLADTMVLKVGSPTFFVDGKKTLLNEEIKPQLVNDMVYLPLECIENAAWVKDGNTLRSTLQKMLLAYDLASKSLTIDGKEKASWTFLPMNHTVLLSVDLLGKLTGKTTYYPSDDFVVLGGAVPSVINREVLRLYQGFLTNAETIKLQEPLLEPTPETDKTVKDATPSQIPSTKEETTKPSGRIKPTPVMGKLVKDANLYATAGYSKKIVANLSKGQTVEILRDTALQWFLVKSSDGFQGWVQADTLSIPQDPQTLDDPISTGELEDFVNEKGFESRTDRLVWVDIDRQMTHVFSGSKHKWQLERSLICATGKNSSPTLRGTFSIKERGRWFYSSKFQAGGKNWVQFQGDYLFHSIPMDSQQRILPLETTLGKRASHGCIRLAVDDSKWFYDAIPRHTLVFIQ